MPEVCPTRTPLLGHRRSTVPDIDERGQPPHPVDVVHRLLRFFHPRHGTSVAQREGSAGLVFTVDRGANLGERSGQVAVANGR